MRVRSLKLAPTYAMQDVHLVGGSSLLYTNDWSIGYAPYPISVSELRLEDETVTLKRYADDGRWAFRFKRERVSLGSLTAQAVPFNLLFPHNYFHFLVESLPGLLRLLEEGVIKRDTVLVTGHMHANFEAALHLLLQAFQLRPARLQLDVGQSVHCDRIVTAAPSARLHMRLDGKMPPGEADGPALVALRERFATLIAPSDGPRRKLYVRRVGSVRNVSNAGAVERMAAAAGYELVSPENLSFVEQARLFASADRIVGPTGAWAANLLFARPGTRVHILLPETVKLEESFWRVMGRALDLEVAETYCAITRLWEPLPIHSDFEAPLDVLETVFAEA